MLIVRGVLIVFLLATLAVPVASAAGGGGGGGGGPAAGGGGGSGADLTKVFTEGVALLGDGDCKKAERKFRTVLKAVARNPEANYMQGVALQCQGKHKPATRSFKKAIRYDEEMYAAYEKLGISYLAIGEQEDAQSQLGKLEEFRQACGEECPATLVQAHAKLVSAMAGPEETRTADPDGDTQGQGKGQHSLLFEPVAEPQSAYLGAVQLINSGDFDRAIEVLRDLTRAIGPHPDVLNYLGYAHRRLRRFDRAQAYYEQALAIDPKHRGANEYLGEMWVELGRLDDARRRLAVLDQACAFGCVEYEDLKRVIEQRVVAAH